MEQPEFLNTSPQNLWFLAVLGALVVYNLFLVA